MCVPDSRWPGRLMGGWVSAAGGDGVDDPGDPRPLQRQRQLSAVASGPSGATESPLSAATAAQRVHMVAALEKRVAGVVMAAVGADGLRAATAARGLRSVF